MTETTSGQTPEVNDELAKGGAQTVTTTGQPAATTKQDGKTDIASLPADIQQYIANLRRENETKRRRADEADISLTNERTAHSQALTDKEAAITALTAERDNLKAEVERVNKTLAFQVEALKKAVPDSMKWAIPSYDDPHKLLEWFASNGEKLAARQAPDLGQGTGNSQKTDKQTDEQLADIKRRFRL